jgi:hypothetical protein
MGTVCQIMRINTGQGYIRFTHTLLRIGVIMHGLVSTIYHTLQSSSHLMEHQLSIMHIAAHFGLEKVLPSLPMTGLT